MPSKNKRLIDLSHTVRAGMATFPPLPGPVIGEHLSHEASKDHYAPGTTFHIGRIEMVGPTGTYVDAPFHRYADGKDLARLPLTSLADLEGIVVRTDAAMERAVRAEAFSGLDLSGKAVLVHTGWAKHWGQDRYFHDHAFLTEDAALYLRDRGAALVGIDSLNIDSTEGGHRPVHSVLLAAEIPIVEHLTHLDQLPDRGFRFFAAPVKVEHFSSFPVRAFAIIDHE